MEKRGTSIARRLRRLVGFTSRSERAEQLAAAAHDAEHHPLHTSADSTQHTDDEAAHGGRRYLRS
jgi:hypothetical protein